ncbi:recombinase family protein, partial [Burkholderia gladioli]|uniref:recombinase family protein n=2 Tax=Burkholderiaceae TaxID=119060 RepID=UPI003F79E988
LVFHMMAALAQFERALISERTRAGMAAAKARGTKLGRKPALTAAQERQALNLLKTQSFATVAQRFQVHPRTLRRLRDRHLAE